jgi:hypothetical protein
MTRATYDDLLRDPALRIAIESEELRLIPADAVCVRGD